MHRAVEEPAPPTLASRENRGEMATLDRRPGAAMTQKPQTFYGDLARLPAALNRSPPSRAGWSGHGNGEDQERQRQMDQAPEAGA